VREARDERLPAAGFSFPGPDMPLVSRPSKAVSTRAPYPLFVLLAASLSCGDSTSPPDHGPPTTMEKVAGDGISGNAGAPLTPSPSVRVTDDEDRPVPGVEVTFQVVGGGGTLTGGVVETDEDGIATAGAWTLGTLGDNALRASATSLTAVTFFATSVCGSVGPLALGGQVSGTLATTDCRYPNGFYTDRYTFTLAAPSTVMFSQTSATFDSYIELLLNDEVVGFHDDIAAPGNLNASMRAVLPAGSYQVGATSGPPNETGAYVVTAQTASSLMTGCDIVFVLPGITTDQELDATDCPTDPPEVFYTEAFLIFMEAGQEYTITLSSTTFETFLVVGRSTSGGLADVQLDDSSDGMNSRLVYTATVDDLYVILASSGPQSTSGAYRLNVVRSP
jgi:hypothetical protein